ncbi:sulfite exporter TauE/SafE family protein [Neisseria wadsworthii]|uniref:sulfite exporter TauE/SafE family protein n=1 Tax=Neisseria wadsworthii TaxID=607711 RepID=UPI001F2864F8|nr:sulfite exporter TauE/SafE family protein [Neisseria wadsworthii]
MPTHDLRGILLPMVAGGLVGSVLASVLPNQILKPALLVCILSVATLTFLKPQLLLPPQNMQERKVSDTRGAAVLLFAVGIYGGFVQASTAFILLPVLAGVLHYNLLRANALKLVCTLAFTIVALAVFIVQGQIWWDVGLVLAAGNILGSMIGVKIALKLSPNTLRTILFVMTVVAVAAAFLK